MSQSWVGRKIADRYQLDELLGAGGMSAVYRAIDPNLRRVVAVKLIHPHLSVNPNFVERFKEEAAAVASLKHPNIVQVYDFNNEGETYYMVMEYLAGETLQARLRRINAAGRHLPIDEAVRINLQICEAASYAHKHDLVHRDIKPANIMLDVNGQAILMDFGIVKIVGGQYHTATGATIGTAVYMSPEQIRSERVDERSDIYSLGVMLFEMLSGRPPFEADSALTLMMMHLNDPIPDPGEIRPDVPGELTAIVLRALAKDCNQRYQTTEEMAQDLRLIQAGIQPRLDKATVVDTREKSIPPPIMLTNLTGESENFPEKSISEPLSKDNKTEISTQIKEEKEAEPDSQIGAKHEPSIFIEPRDFHEAPMDQSIPASLPNGSSKNIPRLQRWLFPVITIGLLLLLASAIIWLVNQRKTPALDLMAMEHPTSPITLETQSRLVSLGKWDVGADTAKIEFSPDSNYLATANNRDWVRFSPYKFYASLWDVASGKLKTYFQGHNGKINSLTISPSGDILATSAEGDSIKLWNMSDGALLKEIVTDFGAPESLDFSANGKTLAGAAWDGVALWQVSNGVLLRIYKAGEGGMKDVAFSPDGNLLASGDESGVVYIWNVDDGSLIHALEGHKSQISRITFSPDGSRLATASDDNKVNIWVVDNGNLEASLSGHTGGTSSIAFSPDGLILASGGWDNTLRLWRVSDGQALQAIEMTDSANDLTFSPDGTWLVTANGDRTLHFWGISDIITFMDP